MAVLLLSITLASTSAVSLLGCGLLAAACSLELRYREGDGFKERAGIVICRHRSAFLVGHGVVGGCYKQLCGANDPYNREDTERKVNFRSVRVKDKLLTEGVSYTVGNIGIFIAHAAAGAAAIDDLGAEDNMLYRFDDSRRIVI